MIAPCEKPIKAVAAGPTPATACQCATALRNAGSAAATRAARLFSLTPRTENHWCPTPMSPAWAATTLTMNALGNCWASRSPSGCMACGVAPTP